MSVDQLSAVKYSINTDALQTNASVFNETEAKQ